MMLIENVTSFIGCIEQIAANHIPAHMIDVKLRGTDLRSSTYQPSPFMQRAAAAPMPRAAPVITAIRRSGIAKRKWANE